MLLFALFIFSFAGEKYGVYDLQGNRISTFEAELHELSEKAQQIKATHSSKSLYISSVSKGKSSKPLSRYRYKVETGAYIEVSRKETFSICPDKEIQGTWISEHSVSLNAENCISVQAPNLVGTFLILFLGNSGKTDTIQVLTEQSYIQMGDYPHRVWVPDSMPWWCHSRFCEFPAYGHYENRKYDQTLIVDKTKLTMGDAQYYYKVSEGIGSTAYLKEYPKNEKFEESNLPFLGDVDHKWRFANERSKKESLDTAYRMFDKRNYNIKDVEKLVTLHDTNNMVGFDFLTLDSSASGYRVPYDDEWLFLMRAGASTRYYWGDEEDSLTVSSYAWFRPIGLKPTAQLLPNRFGLYDMVSLTQYELVETRTVYEYDKPNNVFREERAFYDGRIACTHRDILSISPECDFILNKVGPIKQRMGMPTVRKTCIMEPDGSEECVRFDKPVLKTESVPYKGFRFVRKTPKLHKLDKF